MSKGKKPSCDALYLASVVLDRLVEEQREHITRCLAFSRHPPNGRVTAEDWQKAAALSEEHARQLSEVSRYLVARASGR